VPARTTAFLFAFSAMSVDGYNQYLSTCADFFIENKNTKILTDVASLGSKRNFVGFFSIQGCF